MNNEITPTITNKKCSKCECEKPITEFYQNRTTPDGYDLYCKECRKAANAKSDKAKTPAVSVSLNPEYNGTSDRELQSQAKALLNELRARGWQVECSISYVYTKAL